MLLSLYISIQIISSTPILASFSKLTNHYSKNPPKRLEYFDIFKDSSLFYLPLNNMFTY